MNKRYCKYLLGIILAALFLGAITLLLQYGIFQGVMASKTERSNQQCQTEDRIFDEAKVLTSGEKEKLMKLITQKEKVIGADIVLVTIRDPDIDNYHKIRDYAQNFYEEKGFGWNKPNGDGILYVDNWATGYCWICTTGKATEKLDRNAINYIIKRTTERVNEETYQSYCTMVKTIVSEMQNLRIIRLHIRTVWLAVIAMIVTIIFIVYHLMRNGGNVTTNRSTYVPEGGININQKEDLFLHSHVTRRKIEKHIDSGDSGSSIGGSEGHGGGGGRH